ncbi:hypothetical protein AGLY_002309 [Aphis glycines]|uniref:Uncharacterized protein n=1 Tax=Aphis glycines TaxID=307491 RepID=A0A6G0U4F9_APHGL|nr:hypothetical protein AGLY_002309 [Aphis glycines]
MAGTGVCAKTACRFRGRRSEWFEEVKDNIEQHRLVNDVDSFDSRRNAVLKNKPVNNSLGERWAKLPSLLQRQTVHVENYLGSSYLGGWFHYGCFKEYHSTFVYFVQRALLVLPFLWKTKQLITYFLIQLLKSCVHLGHVSVRHVVYRDRKCFSQSWVKGHRIYLSLVIESNDLWYYQLVCTFWIVFRWTKKANQPCSVVYGRFEIFVL